MKTLSIAASAVAGIIAALPFMRPDAVADVLLPLPGECAIGSWQAPALVTELPLGVNLYDLETAAFQDRLVLVGTPIAPQRRALWMVEPRSLVVLDEEGANLGKPEGGYRFQGPKVGFGPEGSLHMVWAEYGGTEPIAHEHHFSLPASALMYSRYEPEEGWLPAVTIFGGTDRETAEGKDDDTPTNPSTASQPFALPLPSPEFPMIEWIGNRPLHIASDGTVYFASYDLRSQQTTLWRFEEGGDWEGEVLPFGGFEPAVASAPNGRLWISYLWTPLGSAPQELRVAASTDNGASWANPVVAAVMEVGQANRPLLMRGSDGQLHLFWSQSMDGGALSTAVRHAHSDDSGRSWSPAATFPYPGSFTFWDATTDVCGGAHLVYAQDGKLWHAAWDGSWQGPALFYDGVAQAHLPALASFSTGTINLFVTTAEGWVSADSIQQFAIRKTALPVVQPAL